MSPCLQGSPLVVDKWNPDQCGKDAVSTTPVVFSFLTRGLCTQIVLTNLEFQFTTTIVMSMATKCSDLDDWISGANLQNNSAPPHHQVAEKALKRWEHLAVLPPILLLSHQRGDHPLVTPGPILLWECI